jgi:hypothetical protein
MLKNYEPRDLKPTSRILKLTDIMRRCARNLLILSSALIFVTFPSRAAEPNSTGFESAYELTYGYDTCGDRELGSQWGNALQGLAEACPFSSSAKQIFARNTAATEQKWATVKDTHPSISSGRVTCGELLASWQTSELRRRVALYSEGKLSASNALGINCDGGDKKNWKKYWEKSE